MYLENDKHQKRNIEIITLFVTPGAGHVTSFVQIRIHTVSVIKLLFLIVDFNAFYPFQLYA